MDGIKKTLEGEQIDNLEGTSPSGEGGVQLSNSPVPTPEEIEDADGLSADGRDQGEPSEPAQEGGTQPATENVRPIAEPIREEPQTAEKLFTQSQVNDLVGKTRVETREQTYRAVYGRYGVNDEAGMDELVGNAQRYETVRGEYDEARKGWETAEAARSAELAGVKEHVALLESGIDRERFDDAKAIIKAKGLEITVENIQSELATHPEWKGVKGADANPNPNFRPNPDGKPLNAIPTPESTIKVLGNEGSPESGGMSEEEYALKKLFKI